MSAQICAKLRLTLSVSGAEGENVPGTWKSLLRTSQTTRRLASASGVISDEAEDVIQETFVRLARLAFPPNTEDNLRAWLFHVAHHLSMDVHCFQRRWSHNNDEQSGTLIRRRADPLNSASSCMSEGDSSNMLLRNSSRSSGNVFSYGRRASDIAKSPLPWVSAYSASANSCNARLSCLRPTCDSLPF